MNRKAIASGFLLTSIALVYTAYEKTGTTSGGVTGTFLTGPWIYFIAGAVLFVSGCGILAGKKGKRDKR